jgi:hypothetical protein
MCRRGGVPERSNGSVLKTDEGSRPRGFESHPRRLESGVRWSVLRHLLMPSRRLTQMLAFAVSAIAACALATTAAPSTRAEAPGPWCGGTLWRLMTLSDAQRRSVVLHGTPASIADIAKLESPARSPQTRTTPFQRHVWQLRTVIDRYRIASNGEIVLILYSIDSAKYMNAYLPNPDCLGPQARDRTGLIAARDQLTQHCPAATPAWQLLGITVDLAGVGFWNPSRATRGALANGAELRPVTNFKIVNGCGIG